jgi:iron complex transport system permease protein
LGIAGGATTGAAIVFAIGWEHHVLLLPLGAFLGGMLAITLVYQIIQHSVRLISNDSLILAGIAIGAIFSSITSFLMFFSSREQLQQVIFWMMGSLSGAQWSYLLPLALILLVGSAILFSLARELNAMALGDDMAQHLGIHPVWLKRILLLVTTMLTSAAVAFSGTIGFVGLLVPHATRLLIGPDHRWLLPLSGMAGAIFLVLCDWAARVVLRPAELPVGLISALLGAPFFLYLLRTYRTRPNRGTARGRM